MGERDDVMMALFPPLSSLQIEEVICKAEESGYDSKCAQSLIKTVKTIAKKKIEHYLRAQQPLRMEPFAGTPKKADPQLVLTPCTQDLSEGFPAFEFEETSSCNRHCRPLHAKVSQAALVLPSHTLQAVCGR